MTIIGDILALMAKVYMFTQFSKVQAIVNVFTTLPSYTFAIDDEFINNSIFVTFKLRAHFILQIILDWNKSTSPTNNESISLCFLNYVWDFILTCFFPSVYSVSRPWINSCDPIHLRRNQKKIKTKRNKTNLSLQYN